MNELLPSSLVKIDALSVERMGFVDGKIEVIIKPDRNSEVVSYEDALAYAKAEFERAEKLMKSRIVRDQLKKLRRAATFENACFGRIWQGDNPHSLTSEQVDEVCKSCTKLFRETWVLPLIDQLIEYVDGKRPVEELTAANHP